MEVVINSRILGKCERTTSRGLIIMLVHNLLNFLHRSYQHVGQDSSLLCDTVLIIVGHVTSLALAQ